MFNLPGSNEAPEIRPTRAAALYAC